MDAVTCSPRKLSVESPARDRQKSWPGVSGEAQEASLSLPGHRSPEQDLAPHERNLAGKIHTHGGLGTGQWCLGSDSQDPGEPPKARVSRKPKDPREGAALTLQAALTWLRGPLAQAQLPQPPLMRAPPTVHLGLRSRVELDVAHTAQRVRGPLLLGLGTRGLCGLQGALGSSTGGGLSVSWAQGPLHTCEGTEGDSGAERLQHRVGRRGDSPVFQRRLPEADTGSLVPRVPVEQMQTAQRKHP